MIAADQLAEIIADVFEMKNCIIVRRKGREHIRRYKHPVKNGMNVEGLLKRPSPIVEKFIAKMEQRTHDHRRL